MYLSHLEKIDQVRRQLSWVSTVKATISCCFALSIAALIITLAAHFGSRAVYVAIILTLPLLIVSVARSSLFKKITREEACLFLDRELGTKERLTAYQDLVKADLSADQDDLADLIGSQLNQLLPSFDARQLVPLKLDSRLRIALASTLCIWMLILFLSYQIGLFSEKTSEIRAEQLARIINQESNLPDPLRQELKNLLAALKLTVADVDQAMQRSKGELTSAWLELNLNQGGLESKSDFSREKEDLPLPTATVIEHKREEQESKLESGQEQSFDDSQQGSPEQAGPTGSDSETQADQSGGEGGDGEEGEGDEGSDGDLAGAEQRSHAQEQGGEGDASAEESKGGEEPQEATAKAKQENNLGIGQRDHEEAVKEQPNQDQSAEVGSATKPGDSGGSEEKQNESEQDGQAGLDSLGNQERVLKRVEELLQQLEQDLKAERDQSGHGDQEDKEESLSQPTEEQEKDRLSQNESDRPINRSEQQQDQGGETKREEMGEQDLSADSIAGDSAAKDGKSAGLSSETAQEVHEMEPEEGEADGGGERSRPVTSEFEIVGKDEQYDTKYVGSEGEIVKHVSTVPPVTEISDIVLAQPDKLVDPQQQPIPIEYRDMLKQ